MSSQSLLDTYDSERRPAADENILHSTRSTDFITPKSAVSRAFRDAVLMLAKRHGFARRMVNSGRLSQPSVCAQSPLSTEDEDAFAGPMMLGAAALDAPVSGNAGRWLLDYLHDGFTALVFDTVHADAIAALAAASPSCRVVSVGNGSGADVRDVEGLLGQRYDARRGSSFLFRPDQHLCARWRSFDVHDVLAAASRAAMTGCASGEQGAVRDSKLLLRTKAPA